MTAMIGSTAEFVAKADGEDLSPPENHDGQSLLMAALGNTDLSARYGTTQ